MFKKYPLCLHRCPGPFVHEGVAFDGLVVADESSHEAAKVDGWHESLSEAAASVAPIVEPVAPVPQALVDPRAALEAEATALGLKFDGRTTDAKLAERIAETKK